MHLVEWQVVVAAERLARTQEVPKCVATRAEVDPARQGSGWNCIIPPFHPFHPHISPARARRVERVEFPTLARDFPQKP
jgi:hypothetical protein